MPNEVDAVLQSISDSKGHYDIDGVSLWHGHTIVGSGILDSDQTGDENMKNNEMNKRTTRQLTVPIHGLACGGGGALGLERQIKKLKGVDKVYVNPATSEAYVDATEGFQLNEMLKLIKKNGFQYDEPRWN